jgi:hypothetical protein
VLDAEAGELGHTRPALLPGGHGLLFAVWGGSAALSRVDALHLQDGRRTFLVEGYTPLYAPSGHLLYEAGARLWAVPFDPAGLRLRGNPVPVLDDLRVAGGGTGAATYAVSAASGAVVYATGGSSRPRTLVWVDRGGGETAVAGVGPNPYQAVRLSPDGSHLAFSLGRETPGADIWSVDVVRGIATPDTP